MVSAELRESPGGLASRPRARIRMLEQMAEALDDQVAALYRRAAAFEEEEFLLNREVEERQTEINRLSLKLDAMRGERDRVIERIESISREAAAMRQAVVSNEEDAALAVINGQPADSGPEREDSQPVFTGGDPSRSAMFFRRITLADQMG